MKYSTFHKAVKSSKNQLLIITEDEGFYVHLHKISYNEVGWYVLQKKQVK